MSNGEGHSSDKTILSNAQHPIPRLPLHAAEGTKTAHPLLNEPSSHPIAGTGSAIRPRSFR